MPTTSKASAARSGAFPKPEKKNHNRRCDNCGDIFLKMRKDQRFCTKNNGACRKQFHKFGAAYGPLKSGLESALQKKYEDLSREIAFHSSSPRVLEKEVKHLAFVIGGLIERIEKLEGN
jgi:hypothetical protein